MKQQQIRKLTEIAHEDGGQRALDPKQTVASDERAHHPGADASLSAPSKSDSDVAASRIDDAVLAMARLMEANERSQRDANRAIGGLASEINAAARDQAGAFKDLNERIDRLERDTDTSALREAVGDLNQGLSRLTDQTAHTTTQTDVRIDALANTVEGLGGAIVSSREESKRIGLYIQEQLSTYADRLRSAKASLARDPHIEDAVEALTTRVGGLDQIENAIADIGKYNADVAAEINTLADSIETLAGEIDSARADSGRLGERLAAAEGRLASYPHVEDTVALLVERIAGLAEIEQSVLDLGERNRAVAGGIDALAGNHQTLAGEIISAREDSKRLELFLLEELRALGERTQSAEALMASYPRVEGVVERLNARIAVLGQVEQAVADLGKRDAEASAQINVLAGSLQTLNGEVVSAREDSHGLAERLRSAEAVIATYPEVEASVENLRKRTEELGAMENSIAVFGERDAEVAHNINALAVNLEALAVEMFSTRKESSALEERLRSAEERNEHQSHVESERMAGLDRVDRSVADLDRRDAETGRQISALIGNLATLRTEVESVREAPGQLAERLSAAEARIASLLQKNEAMAGQQARLDTQEQASRDTVEDEPDIRQDISRFEQLLSDAAKSNLELVTELRGSLGTMADRISALEERSVVVAPTGLPVHQAAPESDMAESMAPPPSVSEENYLERARRAALKSAEPPTPGRPLNVKGSRTGRRPSRPIAAVGVLLALAAAGYFLLPRATPQTTTIAIKSKSAVTPSATKPQANATIEQERARANTGDTKAMLGLGIAYADGTGVERNEAEATIWLERAAQAGEAAAQFRLGTRYEKGIGVAPDPKRAAYLYTVAAKRGNAKAMYDLGVAYANGTGIDKDPTQAVVWFTSAAEFGLTDAEFNLGVMYESGIGVETSLAEAYKWYAIAGTGGDTDAGARAMALAAQLTPAQKAIADQAVSAFKPQMPNPEANEAPVFSAAGSATPNPVPR